MTIGLYPARIGLGQGQTGGLQVGSGLGVPGGVESVFEFNGLYLNVREWMDTFLVTNVDGIDDADVRDSREQNPSDHGETAFDAYYGGRTITISGKIRAYTLFKLRDLQQALRQAFGDLQEYPLIIRSGIPERDVMIYCKKYQKISMPESQNDFRHWRDFQVSLRAADPFFMSFNEHYSPIVLDSSPKSAAVSNGGNYNSRPRFKLIGPLTNPQIVNTTTGAQMLVNATIPSGDVWEIDIRRKTVTDQDGVNQFGKLDVTSDWLTLVPDSNSIQISATGTDPVESAFQIFWRDTWV